MNIVSRRFVNCHDYLKENKIVRSSRQFALALDYLPQSLSEILKGRRDVTLAVLQRSVEIFEINPIYLFTGKGDMFFEDMSKKVIRHPGHKSDIEFESKVLDEISHLSEKFSEQLLILQELRSAVEEFSNLSKLVN